MLESYRSVTLENFAKAFGVSVDWIDMELAKFISEGRLDARVDKVSDRDFLNGAFSVYA